MSWEERWRADDTPWDAGASPPILTELVEAGRLPEGRALVPGAGRGYDLITLASPRRHVTGLDLAPSARDAFVREHPELRDQVDYVVEDFFTYKPGEPFDLIWDYTFLCALPPDLRPSWTETTASLLKPGAILATLIFPIIDPSDDYQGPPWAMSLSLVRELVAGHFSLEKTTNVARSHPGREGKEQLALWRRNQI